jgi:hypothetical protein
VTAHLTCTRGYAIADWTVERLRKRFGTVTSEREPTSFAGLRVARNVSMRASTISMTETIEQMVREHYPHFLEEKPKGLLRGASLAAAADGMRMPPAAERPKKLSAPQAKTRRVPTAPPWVRQTKTLLETPQRPHSAVLHCSVHLLAEALS